MKWHRLYKESDDASGAGLDRDYWATIYFKITNPKLFEDEICSINELPIKDW